MPTRFERIARGFAWMDLAVVAHDGDGFSLHPRRHVVDLAAMDAVEPFEQGDDIKTALGSGGLDDEFAGDEIARADRRDLCGLTRRFDTQVRAPLRPSAGEFFRSS
jgi:hypothetical protein